MNLRQQLSMFWLILLIPVLALGGTREEKFKKQVEFASGGMIEVDNTNGRIEIEGWDKEEVYIQAIIRVRSDDEDRAAEMLEKTNIRVEKNGGRLEIYTESPKGRRGGFWGWSRNGSVTVSYRIQVPIQSELNVTNSNGAIEISDIQGNTEARTTNGKVIIEKLSGIVEARSTNGSIEIDLEKMGSDGDFDVTTTNGSIRLYLPEESAFEVRAETTNGSVVSDFDVDDDRRSRNYRHHRRSLRGSSNGGGPLISMETTNGSIYLKER